MPISPASSLTPNDDEIAREIPGADAALLRRWRFDLQAFRDFRDRVRSGALSPSSSIYRGKIEPAQVEALPARGSTEARALTERGLAALHDRKVAVVVVAGGMATRFRGAAGPVVKGIVDVVDGKSFLELKRADAKRAGAIFCVMTSFATHKKIEQHLIERGLLDDDVLLFGQSISVRLNPDGSVFTSEGKLGADSYTTPGHGDFFRAVKDTGVLSVLARRGVDTVLFNNVDNLGASVDPLLLGAFMRAREQGVAMMAETVERRPEDGKKVGVVVRADGVVRAVEGFRIADDVDQAKLVDAAINTFTFDVAALEQDVRLDVHAVKKDIEGRPAIQGELVTCEASAVLPFAAFRVKREGPLGHFEEGRFYPVKRPEDLPRVRDLFIASTASSLPAAQRADALHAAFRAQLGVDPLHEVFAPGRVNLIGEHTDYNQGFVLPVAVDRGVLLVAGPASGAPDGTGAGDDVVELYSLEVDAPVRFSARAPQPATATGWGRLAQGVVAAFIERGVVVPGFRAVLSSDLPQGGGMSSSTAVSLAITGAIDAMVQSRISVDDQCLLAQRAEHLVGVQCGIMDQWAIAHGRAGHAMLLDCRDLDTEQVPLDLGEYVVVVGDTAKVRGLVDSEYNARRRECEEAARILGVSSLRDVSEEDLADADAAADAAVADGAEVPKLSPVLRARAEHVVSENDRVLEAVDALSGGRLGVRRFGELLNESHASLRDNFAVSSFELDTMVELLVSDAAVAGARMMGAGFGGCTISIVRRDAVDDVVARVTADYRAKTGLMPSFSVVTASDGLRVTTVKK